MGRGVPVPVVEPVPVPPVPVPPVSVPPVPVPPVSVPPVPVPPVPVPPVPVPPVPVPPASAAAAGAPDGPGGGDWSGHANGAGSAASGDGDDGAYDYLWGATLARSVADAAIGPAGDGGQVPPGPPPGPWQTPGNGTGPDGMS